MLIAIIAAMEQEVVLLRNQMLHYKRWRSAGCEMYIGQLYYVNIVLVKSGIGKVAAALSTTLLLDHFHPDIVINTGSAGSLVPSLQIGDIVISHVVSYYDVDLTSFGYQPGQMAQCPIAFHASPELIALTTNMCKHLQLSAMCGLIVSGDKFIHGGYDREYIRDIFPQALAVEMEATAIAHICYQFKVPFIVIRVITDLADKISDRKFAKLLTVVIHNSSYLVTQIVQCLASQNCD